MGVPIKTTLEIQEFEYQMLEREVLNNVRRKSKNHEMIPNESLIIRAHICHNLIY